MKDDFLKELIKDIKRNLTFNNQLKPKCHNRVFTKTFKTFSSFIMTLSTIIIVAFIGPISNTNGLGNGIVQSILNTTTSFMNDTPSNFFTTSISSRGSHSISTTPFSSYIKRKEQFYHISITDTSVIKCIGIYANDKLYEFILERASNRKFLYDSFVSYVSSLRFMGVTNLEGCDYKFKNIQYGTSVLEEFNGYHLIAAFDLYEISVLDDNQNKKITLFDMTDVDSENCLVKKNYKFLNKEYFITATAVNSFKGGYIEQMAFENVLRFGGLYEAVKINDVYCVIVKYADEIKQKEDSLTFADDFYAKLERDDELISYYKESILNIL